MSAPASNRGSVVVRLFVVTSMIAAIGLALLLIRSGTARTPTSLVVLAFVATLAVSLWSFRAGIGVTMGTAFVAPALIAVFVGRYYWPDALIWLAALAGLIVASSGSDGWALDEEVRWPLVVWALVVSISWPLVVIREINFNPALLWADRVANTRIGMSPPALSTWVAHIAVTEGLGILWFDCLFRRYRGRVAAFERDVLLPLTIGWVLSTVLAAYQAIVDIHFANGGAAIALRRSSGGMMDANPFGLICALWGPIAFALARRLLPRERRVWAPAALILSLFGMWVSGSRGAFIGSIIAVTATLVAASGPAKSGRRWRAVALVGGVAALVIAALFLIRPGANTPVARLAPMFTGALTVPLPMFLKARWDPYFYAATVWRMIQDSPFFGVGIGMPNYLVPDYSALLGHTPLPFDNAQNWFRQEFAEFGLVGSIGWILWVAIAGRRLLRPPADPSRALDTTVAKTVLIVVALVSLMGLPSQHPAVAITFWTLAFYMFELTESSRAGAAPRLLPSRWLTAAALVVALVYAVGFTYSGLTVMRPPLRAVRTDWPYASGLFAPERDSKGSEFRWTAKRAAAAIQIERPWLALTFAIHHPDAAVHPVDVRVWVDGSRVFRGALSSDRPVTKYVQLSGDARRTLVETWVSRVMQPSDYGQTDTRGLGLQLKWRFVDSAAAGESTTR